VVVTAEIGTTGKNGAIDMDVAVIGAGFSGMYMLHKLRDQLHLDARVFEAGDGVGGTWYWNRYPGARCDSESYYYSYSFSPELEQEWTWTSRYPAQPEILDYLNHVADRFDLRRNIQFNTRVVAANFDNQANHWRLLTDSGESITARYVVAATGCLSTGNTPDFPGLDDFGGEYYHTGNWPHDGVDFTGKRVGLIGTGSTGIQATPVIAAQADRLFVFQRTPNFSIPARNAPLTAEESAEIKATYADIRQRCRTSDGGFPFEPTERRAEEFTAAERDAIYEELWQLGGFRLLACSFADLTKDEFTNETAAEFVRQKIRKMVHDPKVAEQLLPFDHPYGTKRPPIDTDYYETFNRDNVTLVDVREAPIQEITSSGLRTSEEAYELDVIVFATGFDAMTGTLLNMGVTGADGRALADAWQAGPRTYLGLQVAGFPNFFTVTGPGSPSVLTNMPVAIEQHVEWIADCIDYLNRHGLSRIEATDEAQEAWVDHVREAGETTLFPRANSWYVGANVPGKSRVFMPYVDGMVAYREKCDEVAAHNYEGFALGN
jgi:cation diffusion facilitator CzcD-associated flavoprotein CzcO